MSEKFTPEERARALTPRICCDSLSCPNIPPIAAAIRLAMAQAKAEAECDRRLVEFALYSLDSPSPKSPRKCEREYDALADRVAALERLLGEAAAQLESEAQNYEDEPYRGRRQYQPHAKGLLAVAARARKLLAAPPVQP